MSFQDTVARFERAESGTDSFKVLSDEAFKAMKCDEINAGLYFVIGIAAQAYVLRYEDQGVTPKFANDAKDTLVALNSKVLQALSSDAVTRLRLLGEVAMSYQWQVHDF